MTGGVGDGLWDGGASISRIVWSGFNTLPVQAILFMKLILLFLLFYQAYGRESCQKRVGLIYIKKTNSNQHQLLASLCRGDQNLLNVNATCFGYLHQSLVHKRTKNPRRNKKTFLKSEVWSNMPRLLASPLTGWNESYEEWYSMLQLLASLWKNLKNGSIRSPQAFCGTSSPEYASIACI